MEYLPQHGPFEALKNRKIYRAAASGTMDRGLARTVLHVIVGYMVY
jgi:hypothetical protein